MNHATRKHYNWEEILPQYLSSGLSAAEWCQQNNVCLNSLYCQLRKRKTSEMPAEPSAPFWIPMELQNGTKHLSIHIGSAEIQVESGFDPQLLRDVVASLSAVC